MLKYKIYNNNFQPISHSELPIVRLLKFKRSKWRRLRFKILKFKKYIRRLFNKQRLKRKKRFIRKKYYKKKYLNTRINKTNTRFKSRRRKKYKKFLVFFFKKFKSYERVKKSFKNGLLLKNSMNQFFGSTLSLKYLKKQLFCRESSFCTFLVKPFFRLDILLWKLKFFYSIKQAQQHIKSKKVLVNGIIVNVCNFFLNKGDTIHILNKDIVVLKKKVINSSFILSFCDVDFYSYKIILLKNFSNFTEQDFPLIYDSYTNLRNYIYYLKKK